MNYVEITLTKDTYDPHDPKLVAFGENPDHMPVFQRVMYGLDTTELYYPSMLKFIDPKDISEVKSTEIKTIRRKYGPVLTEKLKADIRSGKISPKVFFKEGELP